MSKRRLAVLAFVAICKNGAGKTVLLRADFDALPVAEKTGLEYASKKM
jgi:metal-dependent amidase/aminoacylase/carboxypeptidase family protein